MDTNDISEKAGRKTREWQETAQEKASQMKETANQTAEQLRDRAREWSNRARDTARDTFANADSYLHENPWSTIAMVALTGWFLGFLMGRQRD